MNHYLTRFFASLGLVLGTLSFLPAANAALVEYTFVVTPDSGPLDGQSFGGSFSYDDAVTPGVGFGGEDLFALGSFSFNFNGVLYSLADLFSGYAAVDAGGFGELDAGASTFSMLPGFGGVAPFFAYDLDADNTTDADAGNGAIT